MTAVGQRCHQVVREQGLAPALAELAAAVLPGLLPCGPGGHAVVPAKSAATAGPVWLDGVTCDEVAGHGAELAGFDLPGGRVVALRRSAGPAGAPPDQVARADWALGLVWLRLGCSEALRDECVRYLRARKTGESVALQQQLVKGELAEALAEQLEIRAVLTGAPALPELPGLHERITRIDRELLRLLGGGSMLIGGAGEVAYVSELVADAYRTEVAG